MLYGLRLRRRFEYIGFYATVFKEYKCLHYQPSSMLECYLLICPLYERSLSSFKSCLNPMKGCLAENADGNACIYSQIDCHNKQFHPTSSGIYTTFNSVPCPMAFQFKILNLLLFSIPLTCISGLRHGIQFT